ncbi:hypothetical protein C2E23DRAFT_134331 [Lenzites betulinus]|nr:hypothetical protein C2E23DRAFT_134331 [Lenzites betulinus]
MRSIFPPSVGDHPRELRRNRFADALGGYSCSTNTQLQSTCSPASADFREQFCTQPGDHPSGADALPGRQEEPHVVHIPEESAHPLAQHESGPKDTCTHGPVLVPSLASALSFLLYSWLRSARAGPRGCYMGGTDIVHCAHRSRWATRLRTRRSALTISIDSRETSTRRTWLFSRSRCHPNSVKRTDTCADIPLHFCCSTHRMGVWMADACYAAQDVCCRDDSQARSQARSRETHADLLHTPSLRSERCRRLSRSAARRSTAISAGRMLASKRYAWRANPAAPFLHSSFSYWTVLSRQRKSLMMLVLCTQDLVAYDTGQLPHAANARAAPPAIVSSITWGRRGQKQGARRTRRWTPAMARYSTRDGVGKIEHKPETSSGDTRGANVDVSLGVSGTDSEGSTLRARRSQWHRCACVRLGHMFCWGKLKGDVQHSKEWSDEMCTVQQQREQERD